MFKPKVLRRFWNVEPILVQDVLGGEHVRPKEESSYYTFLSTIGRGRYRQKIGCRMCDLDGPRYELSRAVHHV